MIDMLTEKKEFTVSEISFAIKRLVETSFDKVRVKGEVFGAKRADSGHWYLSLKDDNSLLSAVCWKGVANSLPVKIEDGIEVIATGKITTFNGRSSYQLVIEKIEVAGEGALLKLLEERKQKFLAEGLFDKEHKQNIPYLPATIGDPLLQGSGYWSHPSSPGPDQSPFIPPEKPLQLAKTIRGSPSRLKSLMA